MKISFVLTQYLTKPSGGYKMVYQYANYLRGQGNDVGILFFCNLAGLPKWKAYLKKMVYRIRFLKPLKWFKLDKRVRKKLIWEINDGCIPNGDAIIATAVGTSFGVSELSLKKGRKFYFIQGYETFLDTEKRVLESYCLGLHCISVSRWLGEIVSKYALCDVVTNGISLTSFFPDNAVLKEKDTIAFMWARAKNKGGADGIEVLRRLKRLIPSVKVELFSKDQISFREDWIHVTCNASEKELRNIYNKSSVYLCTSHEEGFGLTGLEAMACGCPLVSTRTKGVLEYARHRENALLCEVGDLDSLVNALVDLLTDGSKRNLLSEKGVETARRFDIEKSEAEFCGIVTNAEK